MEILLFKIGWFSYFTFTWICQKVHRQKLSFFFRVEIGHEFKKESPIDIEFRKLSLFAFEIYYFSSFIHTIKKNCPEGIFHQFSFEESVFFLYLHPFNQEFIFSKKKYHKNIDFYINCIAAATKAFMEGLGYKHDRKSYTTNDNSSLSELIFLDFLDFYETNLKTNENTCEYFLWEVKITLSI